MSIFAGPKEVTVSVGNKMYLKRKERVYEVLKGGILSPKYVSGEIDKEVCRILSEMEKSK